MNSYWLESSVFNYKNNNFDNSCVLIIDLSKKFSSNCDCCDYNYYNNKCFYCFTSYLRSIVYENKYIYNIIFEIDDMDEFENEIYKYTVLELELKQIYNMAENNNLVVFCKKISVNDKNLINEYINEKMIFFLSDDFIY